MIRDGVKILILYLEDWQKRMIKDFLGTDCNTYEIAIPGPESKPVMKYAIPTSEELKRMYFTEWQKREMRDETGVACEFVELHKDVGIRYMGPHVNK